ncbi:DEFECTIVE EMBRYO AND MERISTEMS 2 [Hibiscus trionum]|uniref:DEFECTIVE EMBRYO AND MERISTEMS 2 n=1 Tax=Hibiscus trionum TaxID=183268 RepID=A0A9W7LTD0_HIBTR|nr:DEFECTIVE EMBRYO AND MERISTEMS 2 [Hibiscus trionum]
MGTSQSREDLIIDSDCEEEEDDEDEEAEEQYVDASGDRRNPQSSVTHKSLDEIDSKLRSLKLKYNPSQHQQQQNPNLKNPVKLYLHAGGNTPKAKWVISDKLASYNFSKSSKTNGGDGGDDGSCWVLEVGSKVRVRVSAEMQLKMFGDQKRVDFVAKAVWALKFLTDEEYGKFVNQFQNCLFENVYGMEASEENKVKVFGKEFIGWVKPEVADDSVWEDAKDHAPDSTPAKANKESMKEFEEAANGGVQSLALGALDNSFLVNDVGVQVYRNCNLGIQGKGICLKYEGGSTRSGGNKSNSTPKKAMLMRAETNMMLMSPEKEGKPNATGLKQVDIETGKIVTEWKFEKDGTDITMRDISNDTKGSQLDPSESTFLGLDDNRLCQWDMRDRKGMVQDIAKSDSPVLHWTQGHQFSRGTNFQCFASTGDGSIVVGSRDGKIRLYSKTSMRQAKTAFPGLGSPITHVDVTYDGKWVLGTTDTYLVLICTMFTDKDGKIKTGFAGRMGNKIPAPRLLKLTPLDSHLAGNNNKFHGGHFSWVTENGKQERHLVATVGKFSVIWDFQQVKNTAHECYRNQQGLKSCYCYKIVLKDDDIVESRFMHDKFSIGDSPEAPLVVATPMKISSISLSGGER